MNVISTEAIWPGPKVLPKVAISEALEPIPRRLVWMIIGGGLLLTLLAYVDIGSAWIQFGVVVGLLLVPAFSKGLKDPTYLLVAFALYIPFLKFIPGALGGFAFNLTNVFFLAWIAFLLFGPARPKGTSAVKNPLLIPFLLIVLLTVISVIRGILTYGAPYFDSAAYELKRRLDPVLLYFLAFRILDTRKCVRPLIIAILVVVLLSGVLASKEHYLDRADRHGEGARVKGLFLQANDTGAFFAYYMFLFAAMVLVYFKSVRYWWLTIPFTLCLMAVNFTGSRGAILASVTAALFVALFRSRLLFLFVVGVLVVLYLNPALLPETIETELQSTLHSKDEGDVSYGDLQKRLDASSATRLVLWEGAWKMISEYPLFGVGLGVFNARIEDYISLDRYNEARDAHNAFVRIAAEMGIPALLTWAVILMIVLWNALRLYYETHQRLLKAMALGLAAAVIALITANMFGSRLENLQLTGYFWILSAIVLKIRKEQKREVGRQVEVRCGASVAP